MNGQRCSSDSHILPLLDVLILDIVHGCVANFTAIVHNSIFALVFVELEQLNDLDLQVEIVRPALSPLRLRLGSGSDLAELSDVLIRQDKVLGEYLSCPFSHCLHNFDVGCLRVHGLAEEGMWGDLTDGFLIVCFGWGK